MTSPAPLSQLVNTVRTQASALLGRARSETADQIAQLSGRAASWADQAGEAVGEASEEAAASVSSAGRSAADTAAESAERYVQLAGDRLARATGRATHSLGELALRLGEAITDSRSSRD
jgi:ubiquinone biosynthesis protein UbiJ